MIIKRINIDGKPCRTVNAITTDLVMQFLEDNKKQNMYSEGGYSMKDFWYGIALSQKKNRGKFDI